MSVYFSLIIPCFDEEKRIESGLEHFLNYLKKQKYFWELIIIDDGSKDRTLEMAQLFKTKSENIKLISYPKNKGKGYAIVQGVKKAKGNIIAFSDIDHSVPIKTIDTFFKSFDLGYKVVIGSRRVKGAKILVKQHPIRQLLGNSFSQLVRILINWEIKDATCGFKAFEGKVAKKVFSKISIYDWAFDAELLYIIKKRRIDLLQLPVEWSDSKSTKVSLTRDIPKSLISLLKIRTNSFFGKYN